MNIKSNYYLDSVSEFMVFKYYKTPTKDRKVIPNPEEYYEISAERLKKTNPEMYSMLEQKMHDENERRRAVKAKGAYSIPEDTKKEMIDNLHQSVLDDRKENPEKYKQIQEDIANTNRERGHYKATSKRMKEFRANQDIEEQRDAAKKMNDTLSNTPGKRESMTVNGLITKEKTRNNNLKDIYEIIQETGWFTKEEVHAKYKFKGVNGDIIGNQQLRNVFDDAIELGLFESKYMNVVILNGGARRTYYTKVVEGKDIDLKSLKDKVNLDNEKVRAARLTDKDYLAKQAKRKLKIGKLTEIKNKKRLKEYLSKLPKTGITQKMIKDASPNHGWHGKLKEALEIESQPLGRTGKINVSKCTWKKK